MNWTVLIVGLAAFATLCLTALSLRFVYDYHIEDRKIRLRLFNMIPVYSVSIDDIRSIRQVSWRQAGIGGMTLRLGNRIFSATGVLIEKRKGLFRKIVVTPENPDRFIAEIENIRGRNAPATKMNRPLTDIEKSLIARIADKLPDAHRRQQLMADMENATAEPATDDGSRIVFYISGYQRPNYRGQHSFGVEGTVTDQDGSRIWIDLYADENDRLLELELVREMPGRLLAPDWRSLTFY